ncbi:MAG: hypothetical protein ABIW76_14320 [Fibrobacteria bacterium]
MNNGLVDEDSSFIPVLMVVGIAIVSVLLIVGLFMPTVTWSW